jgi:hypothetical protein
MNRWWPAIMGTPGAIVNVIAREDQDPDAVGIWLQVVGPPILHDGQLILDAADANGTRYTTSLAFPGAPHVWFHQQEG